MKTYSTKKSDIKRQWHLVDAQDMILGRLATSIAAKLIGKHKPYFSSYLDCGDYVVVINADKVKVSGRKQYSKKYYRHSQYPGGFKATPFATQLKNDSRQIIISAVKSMLPKNKLQAPRLKRLKTFSDNNHIYQDKFVKKESK